MAVRTAPAKAKPDPIKLVVGPGPRNARTDPNTGLRFYRWGDREVPSVTTIRRMAGLPHGLHQWALNQVIAHALDNISSIAGRLASGDPAEVQLLKKELRGAATAERDRAADLGTAVHDAAAQGKALTDVPPEVAPRLRQYLDWLAASKAEILAAEFQVWNLTIGYAGTCDLLARFPDGSIDVVDLKTGKGIYGEYALQVMAYLMGEFVGADDVVDEEATALLQQATGMAVLHLVDDGWEYHRLHVDPTTWGAFRGLLAFARWMADHATVDTISAGSRKSSEVAA